MVEISPQLSSRLLCLPLELRENILLHLLALQTAAPTEWKREGLIECHQLTFPNHDYCSPELIPWPPSPNAVGSRYLYTTYAVMLSCRQLCREIKDVVSRHSTTFPYHLEIIIIPGPACKITWLSLPAPPSAYDRAQGPCLDVDIRPDAVTVNEAQEQYSIQRGSWYGCGGLGDPFVMLLLVLSHWFEGGPTFIKSPANVFPIDKLRLHFVVERDAGDLHRMSELLQLPVSTSHREMNDRMAILHLHFGGMKSWLRLLPDSGLMFGRFGTVSLDVKGLESDHEGAKMWVVKDQSEEDKRRNSISWSSSGWLPGKELLQRERQAAGLDERGH